MTDILVFAAGLTLTAVIASAVTWALLRQYRAEVERDRRRDEGHPSAPAFRPDQLLGARHDHPDQTGPVVDAEFTEEHRGA